MFVLVFVLCFIGSALCDKLITRSGDSYRVYVYVCVCVCVCVCAHASKLCVVYKPKTRGYLILIWAVGPQKRNTRKFRALFTFSEISLVV